MYSKETQSASKLLSLEIRPLKNNFWNVSALTTATATWINYFLSRGNCFSRSIVYLTFKCSGPFMWFESHMLKKSHGKGILTPNTHPVILYPFFSLLGCQKIIFPLSCLKPKQELNQNWQLTSRWMNVLQIVKKICKFDKIKNKNKIGSRGSMHSGFYFSWSLFGFSSHTSDIEQPAIIRYNENMNTPHKTVSVLSGWIAILTITSSHLQGHNNAAKSSPSSLPDRPSASLQNTIEPDDVEEWWKTLSDPAPVPPLLLQSPVESQKGLTWLSGTHNTSNHFGGDSAQNDVDNQMVFFASMEQNVSDFDLVEGNSRVKLDKSVSRRDDIPKLFLDDLIEDQSDSKRRRAAINIQRWFRGWKTRKELRGKNAVKELLSQKKIEKEKQILDNAYSPGLVCVESRHETQDKMKKVWDKSMLKFFYHE